MQVLLSQKSWNIDVAVLLIQDLYPDETFSRHDSFHEPEVEAPDHNNTKDNGQRSHNNPVLNIVEAENGIINGVINTILILVDHSIFCVDHGFIDIFMILFQEWIKQQCALCERYEEYKETNVPSNHSE